MSKRIWKKVVGYGGNYEVSQDGQVRSWIASYSRQRTKPLRLKQSRDAYGYCQVNLTSRQGRAKTQKVHRLVLAAFKGAAPRGKECGHFNGKRADNRLSNLGWISRKENCAHKKTHGNAPVGERNPQALLTEKKVRKIRQSKLSNAQCARVYKVSYSAIYAVRNGLSWKEA